jgi:hypothetical protein
VRDRHGADHGVPTQKVVERLWARWRIIATPIVARRVRRRAHHAERLHHAREIDTFARAMEKMRERASD